MPETPEGKIAQALKVRTVLLAQNLQMPLSWLGWNFDVPQNRRFLRAEHRPNTTVRRSQRSNGAHIYLGILQISVHWPLGGGEPALRDAAGSVVAFFPCDQEMTEDDVTVRVVKRPEAPDFMLGSADMSIPVMIEYECFY